MSLSKRPKGKEIEEFIRDYVQGKSQWHDREGHSPEFNRLKRLKNDMDLLMAHLKLEFKDVPGTPAKRVVTKATKKPKKTEGHKYNMANPSYTSYINEQPGFFGSGTGFFGSGAHFPQWVIKA